MIAKDSKSAEIIKPLLRGRDIKRYSYEWAGLWIIATFPAKNIDINEYPAIKEYLQSFGKRLEQSGEKGCRKKTGNKWFETQDQIAYWKEFEKEKIVWAETSQELKFFYDNEYYILDKTCFMIVGNNLKYIISIVNSKIIGWYVRLITSNLGKTGLSLPKDKIKLLPIPLPTPEAEQVLTILVDFILFAKEHNFEKEAQLIESVIDIVVFGLYFEDKMKEANCYILPRLSKTFQPLKKNSSFAEKVKQLKTLYNFLLKDSKIQNSLIHSYLIDEVQLINEHL